MSVILREGEEQVQPGQEPEEDGVWTRPSFVTQEGLRQRHPRALAAGMNIYTTLDTKHTEWVELVRFPATLAPFASDKDEVAKEAKQHIDDPDKQSF